jgi:hypothetical protein
MKMVYDGQIIQPPTTTGRAESERIIYVPRILNQHR